ncbi:hypothetical protein [Rhizobium nepotum]|jgi:hypothetical protein|uniref:hypothetical protein n=1 Tax=Rhizobium nepotum TaxID=1035271 RepID=UPI003CF7AEF9
MMDWNWFDWFPVVFLPFKLLVLGTGMFFAIKWHHDQAKKDNENSGKQAPAERTLDASD